MNEYSGEEIRKLEKQEKIEGNTGCESVAVLEGDENERE
jgi:hypothetical protein